MPVGPKGEKRPADVIGNAVKVMRIATGEEDEITSLTPKRAKGGAIGGRNRAASGLVQFPSHLQDASRYARYGRWIIGYVMDWAQIVEAMDANAPVQKHGPYKKRGAEISN
jgi:hypothetical protein